MTDCSRSSIFISYSCHSDLPCKVIFWLGLGIYSVCQSWWSDACLVEERRRQRPTLRRACCYFSLPTNCDLLMLLARPAMYCCIAHCPVFGWLVHNPGYHKRLVGAFMWSVSPSPHYHYYYWRTPFNERFCPGSLIECLLHTTTPITLALQRRLSSQ